MQSAHNIDETLPDFTGKCVVFYLANVPSNGATTLHSPTFERQVGRLFVVGDVVASRRGQWAAGLRAGVAWDEVIPYIVFESPEDYSARFKSHVAQSPRSFRLFRRR